MPTGLGALAVLSDELLLGLLSLLPAQSLGRASLASKSLYCFSNHEELWRVLVLEVRFFSSSRLACLLWGCQQEVAPPSSYQVCLCALFSNCCPA